MSAEQAPVSTDTARTAVTVGDGLKPDSGQSVSHETFKVPDAYAGKPWVEKIKSNDDVWKTLDNAQSLIGKKTNPVPGENATAEEIANFNKLLGVPEDAKGYQFKAIENLPEGVDLSPYQEKASAIFHKAGLTPKQAQAVWDEYIKDELETANQQGAASKEQQAALDKEFDEITKAEFGDKYDEAAKSAQELINQYVPDTLKTAYGELADKPKALAAVIKALSSAHEEIAKVKAEFGAEGKLSSGEGSGGQNAEEVLKELTDLRVAVSKMDAWNDNEKKKAGMEKIKELETQYRSMVK